MDLGSRVYEFELWSSSGVRLADISSLVMNRRITLQRNEAEQVTFDLDLYAFENFCRSINADPHTLLAPYQTDIKIKRAGQYWIGAQVVGLTFDLAADFSRGTESGGGGQQKSLDQKVVVTATGYLNLFKDRYVTYIYTQQDAAFIGGDMLTQTQSQTNGSVGVTIQAGNYMTGVLRDRTLVRQNVKSELQNLTQLIDGRFDFAFTYDKKFITYAQIGSKRTDLKLIYGGPDGNIIGLYLDRSAANLYNRIIGLGSGFGADQLTSIQNDNTSQVQNYLREDIKQYNSIINQSPLDQNATADLALEKDLLEIPQVTITGKEITNIPFLSIGDRIPISTVGHPFLSNLTGYYRIEKMIIDIDENDFENELVLYFDNYAVS